MNPLQRLLALFGRDYGHRISPVHWLACVPWVKFDDSFYELEANRNTWIPLTPYIKRWKDSVEKLSPPLSGVGVASTIPVGTALNDLYAEYIKAQKAAGK